MKQTLITWKAKGGRWSNAPASHSVGHTLSHCTELVLTRLTGSRMV